MLSTGSMDGFPSQVDVKGKIGPASLKENVCQVSLFVPPSVLARIFTLFFFILELSDDRFVTVCVPAGV